MNTYHIGIIHFVNIPQLDTFTAGEELVIVSDVTGRQLGPRVLRFMSSSTKDTDTNLHVLIQKPNSKVSNPVDKNRNADGCRARPL